MQNTPVMLSKERPQNNKSSHPEHNLYVPLHSDRMTDASGGSSHEQID